MDTASDSVPSTPPASGVITEPTSKRSRKSKNGPLENRNHLDELSPSLRDYVLEHCKREGIPVTSVRVVSPTEVILP